MEKIKANVFAIAIIKSQDPFDAYEWLDSLHKNITLQPIYFFLMAIEKGKYDKNIDVTNPEFQQLVQSLAQNIYRGFILPGQAQITSVCCERKKRCWKIITEHPVKYSRQHLYVLISSNLPALIAIGFRADYSMGYGDINGFRASICTPYYGII